LESSAILQALCIRLFEVGSKSSELIEASVLALRVSNTVTGLQKRHSKLRALFGAFPQNRRRQIFEADLACIALFNLGRDVRHRFGCLAYEGALSYTPEQDWQWILDTLSEPTATTDYRAVLLRLAIYVAAARDGNEADFSTIRRAVTDSCALVTQLNEAVEANKPSKAVLRMLDDHRKRKEQWQQKLESQQRDWLAFREEVANRPALALAPSCLGSTLWKLCFVLSKNGGDNEEGRWNRAFFEMHFGHEVTDVIRRALMSYWRGMKPSMRSERKTNEKNTYLMVWSIGLMGIYAEAEDLTWSTRLNDDEVELAVRYALLELNGLPNWLTAVAEANAVKVERIIGGEIFNDLAESSGKDAWYSILLHDLRCGPTQLAKFLQPRLLSWLGDPGENLMRLPYSKSNENKLNQVVRVLLTHGDQSVRSVLEDIAAKQVEAVANSFFLFWLPVLCHLNPARGAAILLEALVALPVEQCGFAVRAIGCLFNRRHVENSTSWSSTLTADLILKLTIAIHRHVRHEDDLVHESVYTPDYRDFAEEGRRYIFEALMQASGPEAMRAKLELAEHPMFSSLRDRIAALAQERLAAEVDSSVAEISEIASLFKAKELPPKTGSDMAQLLIDRLDDLQELMLRDAGPRAAWAAVNDENTLRPAIAHELENAAKGAYTVDQEGVTVDGKETDIRLRSVSGHQATIELKLGKKSQSSAKVLQDAIKNQLVKKYMAHKMSSTGCLLVAVSDPTKRWRHPKTKALIDRVQLQELLDATAQTAQQQLGGDARVIARVLDLTPCLPTEAKLRSKPAEGTKRFPACKRVASQIKTRR
jgi:hypothetical protein